MIANHYVNNAKMLNCLKDYRLNILNNDIKPKIPEYLGECILKIATRLSYKSNFINYSYRDDMISDGIENCIHCINSFDPEKSSNPFAYFTQVIYFAFLRRIAKEKKQSYIKHQLVKDMPFDAFDMQEHDDDSEFKNSYMSFIQTHQNFDASFFVKKEPKEKNEKFESLDAFL
jgi:DNA-directed RNA polymerase specialized sigma subunit